MLVQLMKLGRRVDAILFADTGGERPDIYAYGKMLSHWLELNQMPPITVVKKGGIQETLEENCLRLDMLPSLAYGFKGCSHKYKIEPQDKWVNNWQPARERWKSGGKVLKLIGYDMDEPHRAAIPEDAKYQYAYPLLEWGWGREECLAAIAEAGLPQPGKSACFFCPSTTKPEILALREQYPELLDRALHLEANAKESGNLKTVNGLGRRLNWGEFLSDYDASIDASRVIARTSDVPVACGCYDGGSSDDL